MAAASNRRTRPRTLLSAGLLVVFLLTVAGPAEGASAVSSGVAEFQLHADGFLVAVKTEVSEKKVDLTLYRRGQVAAYEVPATLGENSLKAQFGRFGELNYSFIPGPGSGGCGGSGEGTFRGTFTFTGESRFIEFAADHAHGTFFTDAANGCKEGGPPLPSPTFRRSIASPRPAAGADQEVTLAARLDPPTPLLGTAVLRPRRHGPPNWSGSLRAPVLGAAPIRLAGPGIVAHLGAGSPLD